MMDLMYYSPVTKMRKCVINMEMVIVNRAIPKAIPKAG